jgi:hypothetical protein
MLTILTMLRIRSLDTTTNVRSDMTLISGTLLFILSILSVVCIPNRLKPRENVSLSP